MALVGEKSEVTFDMDKIKIRIHNVPMDGHCFFTSFLASLLDKKLDVNPKYRPLTNDQEILRKNLVEFMNCSDYWKKHRLLILNGEKMTEKCFQNYAAGFLTTRWGDDFAIQMVSEMMDVPILVFQLENNNTELVESNQYLPTEFKGETTLENSVLLLFIRSQSHFQWIQIVENSDENDMDPDVSKNQNKSDSAQSLLHFCRELNIDSGKMNLHNFMNFNRLIGPSLQVENPGLSESNLKILMKLLWKESILSVPMDTDSKNSIEEYSSQPWFLPPNPKRMLKKFQIDSLNSLRNCWKEGRNVILADEQGLGKTIQTIVFLRSLVEEQDSIGRFLLVVPLNTIDNWNFEFTQWAPDLTVVTYQGEPPAREKIRLNELKSPFQVLLTSYDWIKLECEVFSKFKFQVLVVDEGHNLKNLSSKFVIGLKSLDSKFKLLLTGTPFQNSIEDFFTQLNFLDENNFDNLKTFLDLYGDLNDELKREELKKIVKSIMIRRTAAEALDLPFLKIVTIQVNLTDLQTSLYEALTNPSSKKSKEMFKLQNGSFESLLNPDIQRQKVVNSPLLFEKFYQEAVTEDGKLDQHLLVNSSAKMIVLQKILKELKKGNHRVLIFNLMTKMIDLLAKFLEAEGYEFERMDGNTEAKHRPEIIKRFNSKNSTSFIFLLNTLSGGVGLNLQEADTVIIYESHCNPQNDLQAIKRVHRIGQEKPVLVLRLVTNSLIEEKVQNFNARKIAMSEILTTDGNDEKLLTILTDPANNFESLNEIVQVKSDTNIPEILIRDDATEKSTKRNNALTSFPDFDPFVFLCPESGKSFKYQHDLQNHRKRFYPFNPDYEHLFEGWLVHPRETGIWCNPARIQIRDFDPVRDERLFIHYGYFLHKKDKNGQIIDTVWQSGYTSNIHDVKGEIKNRCQACESLLAVLDDVNGYQIDWTSLCTLGYSDYLNGSTSIAQDIKFTHRSLSPIGNYNKLIIDHNRVSTDLKDNLMEKMMKFKIPVWKVKEAFPHTHPPYPGGGNDYYEQVLKAREKVRKFADDFPGVILDLDLEIKHPPPPPTVNKSRKTRISTKKCTNPTKNPRCKLDAVPGYSLCGSCRWIERSSKHIKKCRNPTKNPRCQLNAEPGRTLCNPCRWIAQTSKPTKKCSNPTKNPGCKIEAEPGTSLCNPCRSIQRSSNVKKCSNATKNSDQKTGTGPPRSKKGKFSPISSSEDSEESEFERCSDESEID